MIVVEGSSIFTLLTSIDREEEVLILEGLPFLEANVICFLIGVAWLGTIEREMTSVITSERFISVLTFLGFDSSLVHFLGVETEGWYILEF